jgi:hypothetical protein
VTFVRHLAGIVLTGVVLAAPQAHAQRQLAAVFLFEFDNAGLHSAVALTPHDRARLGRLDAQLVLSLERSGQYAPIAVPVDPAWPSLWTCDGCEVEAARRVGAQVAVTGWVRRRSDLDLTLTLAVRDVATGARVAGGSVDVRGDSDESWTRGLADLLRNEIPGSATAQ